MKPVIILSTYPDKKSVTRIAHFTVKNHLAACVNFSKISSIYSWKEKIENKTEYLALFKTTEKKKAILINEIKKTHPYKIPEIIELDPKSMNKPYLDWLVESTT